MSDAVGRAAASPPGVPPSLHVHVLIGTADLHVDLVVCRSNES